MLLPRPNSIMAVAPKPSHYQDSAVESLQVPDPYEAAKNLRRLSAVCGLGNAKA